MCGRAPLTGLAQSTSPGKKGNERERGAERERAERQRRNERRGGVDVPRAPGSDALGRVDGAEGEGGGEAVQVGEGDKRSGGGEW